MKREASRRVPGTRGSGDRADARRHELGRSLLALAVATLPCGCPQRLDDDFRQGVSAAETPDTLGPLSGPEPDVGEPDTGSDGPDAGPETIPTPPTSPRLVASDPTDGARGVLPEATLVLTFSAPMDRASVEAAYTSSDLPASSVSFTWSDADTVLRVRPRAPLRSSAGTDAATLQAVSHAIELGAGARDAAGNALAPRRITFSTARAISRELLAVTDRDLTGNWRSDGSYGLADCERADTTVCFGDSPAAGEPAYRGFMTFDLRPLPTDLIAFTAAELSCSIALVYGTPFTNLGALHIDRVAFETIGDAAFATEPFPERQSRSAPMLIGDVLAVDALAAVRADWTVRDYNQYRLAFTTTTDGDAAADQLGCDWSTVQLALTYWLP